MIKTNSKKLKKDAGSILLTVTGTGNVANASFLLSSGVQRRGKYNTEYITSRCHSLVHNYYMLYTTPLAFWLSLSSRNFFLSGLLYSYRIRMMVYRCSLLQERSWGEKVSERESWERKGEKSLYCLYRENGGGCKSILSAILENNDGLGRWRSSQAPYIEIRYTEEANRPCAC